MKKFLAFCHKHGLASSVTDLTEAIEWAKSGNLTSAQLRNLGQIAAREDVDFDATEAKAKQRSQRSDDSDPEPDGNGGGGQRSGTGIIDPNTPPVDSNPTNPGGVSAAEAARQAIADERQRNQQIRTLAAGFGDAIPEETVERCINEGLTLERSQTEFLTALRERREEFSGTAPAGHSRSRSDITIEVLQAALCTKSEVGINPDSEVLNSQVARNLARHQEMNAGWMLNSPASGAQRDNLERAFDVVEQRGLQNLSLMRALELAVEAETGQRYHDDITLLERGFSSGAYQQIYGAVIHLMLYQSYEQTANSYSRICQVVDLGDFREHKDADMGRVGRLKRQGYNGGKAPTLNVDDPALFSLMIQRFAGQLKVTDQMIIDDALGVTNFLPVELGETCVHMVDDLAWSQVLDTANLDDGRQRYNATDGNLITAAAFDSSAIESIGEALKAKKVQGRRIRIREGLLAAGTRHIHKVRKFMRSETIDHARNTHQGTYDTLEDTAIDLGVEDPQQDDLAIAGTPDSIYAFAGQTTKRPIKMGFRRGTNRGPVTRRFTLDKGEWGVGWDVYMDMGAAFQRRIGTVRLDLP